MNRKNKPADLLLINSLAPRARSLSDTALENSLAILRTYLEDRGFGIDVIDPLRIDSLEDGVPQWCFTILRILVSRQMAAYSADSKGSTLSCMLAAWPFQSYAMGKRKKYMDDLVDKIVHRIRRDAVPFVGIKVWYGDSFRWSSLLASRIREASPETVVIAGGPQVTVYRDRVTGEGAFDIAVMGPGEEVIERLLLLRRQTKGKAEFLGRVVSDNNGSPLLSKDGPVVRGSRLDPPKGHVTTPRYRDEDLKGKIRFHTIVDGFGCTWNKCHFCTSSRLYSHYRPRPVEQVIAEIREMASQGIAFFRFSSSDSPLAHGRKIAQAILDQGLTVRYSMFSRASAVTAARFEAYQTMIRAGLRAVFIGGETGHDLVNRRVMNKGVTRQDIVDTIGAIRRAAESVGERCKVGLAMIYPCPLPESVSIEDVFDANVAMVMQTQPDTVVVNPPGAFPETAWFEDSQHFHFNIGHDFVSNLMRYEYAMYKPPELWPKLEISLEGQPMEKIVAETGRLRRKIASLGIPTEIADEYLMMADAIGVVSKEDLMEFKRNSLIDIFSGSVTYTRGIIDRVNRSSMEISKTRVSPQCRPFLQPPRLVHR